MDNMGAGGGSSERNPFLSAPENAAPMGEVPDFNEFLKQNEQLRPNMEMSPELAESAEASVGERAAEGQAQGMPAPMTPPPAMNEDEMAEAEVKAELGPIEIKRDAENLPKAYMQSVVKIINRDKKDPHKLSKEIDVARWDMMSKTFGRNRGDGLNGRV